ncbi:MAG: cytochrome c biogenesis protein CcdA [Candidatus Omnitrophota bacterium]|nr:cytochrome c biogenesis protein CcdA [Candidatus Omnitrophota bacterium]
MDQVSFGIAFSAGVLSFLSPCVLPLVPGYISFLSGVSLEDLRKGNARGNVIGKAGLTSIFFVIGFSVVFIALGASASFVGKLLADNIRIFTRIAGVVIVLLGLHLAGVLNIKWLNYEKRLKIEKFRPGLFGAFLIGLAFAFGWTPCIGPILAGILALAAAEKTVLKGMLLLAVYSLGLGIPFIVTGFAVGAFMRFFEKYRRFIRWGEIVAGIFLIAIGVLIFTDNLSVLARLIPESVYKFSG